MTVAIPLWLGIVSVAAHVIELVMLGWMLRHLSLAEGELRALRRHADERSSRASS